MAQGIKANISKEELEKLLQEYTIKEIAEILNVSVTTIGRYKKKFGLQANPLVTSKKNSENHSKYSYNINYFDNIDTMNKAYLLGFICADGFITDRHEIGIEVSKKDKKVVEFFQKELETNKPIIEKDNLGSGSAGLRVQNIKLYEEIKKYGICSNKSLSLNIEDVIKKANLSEKQISAFLLGYFDGDGCISLAHRQDNHKEYFEMNITGTKETINYYKEYFKHGTITKRHKDDKNNYTLQFSNNFSTIYNALSKLYEYKDEIDFFFERKYNLFVLLKTKVKS